MGCDCPLHICQLQAMCPHNSAPSQSYSNSMHLAENSHNTHNMAVNVTGVKFQLTLKSRLQTVQQKCLLKCCSLSHIM